MATASSVIGSLQVNITAATHGLEKGLHHAREIAGGFVEDLKTSVIGALAALPFAEALKSFVEAGEELEHLSVATGVSVEQLSFLKYAATQTGASLETLTKAARELQTKGIDPARFEEIATTIAAIKDPTMRAQSAMYYFGKKSAIALLPLINDLPKLKERFEQLGGGLTDQMVKAADEMGASWGNLKFTLANIGYQIAYVLAPYVTELSNYIALNGKEIRKWISDHKKLILALSGVSTVIALLTPVMFILHTGLKLITSSANGAVSAFKFFENKPNLVMFTALIAVAADLTSILSDLENQAISTWRAVSQIGNALGGVGGFIPKAHFDPGSITPDGTQPAASTEVAKNTARTADSMEQLLAVMKERNEGQPQPPPPAPVFPVAGVR